MYPIAGRPHKIIGVLPRTFWFFTDSPSVWTLIQQTPFEGPNAGLAYAIARVRPGFSDKAVLDELRRLYRTQPPVIKARQVELRRMTALTQDPFYRSLPVAFAVLFSLGVLVTKAAGTTCVRLRGPAYLLTKVSLTSFVAAVAAIEFAYAPGMRMSGVRGFAPEAFTLWFIIVGIVIALWSALEDQRKRCPACLSRLSMPVQMGSRGHVLMESMSTELVCPNGHGILWAPEDSLESHPKDRWLRLDESWHDLFAVPDKH
jgi:hypothetical protein